MGIKILITTFQKPVTLEYGSSRIRPLLIRSNQLPNSFETVSYSAGSPSFQAKTSKYHKVCYRRYFPWPVEGSRRTLLIKHPAFLKWCAFFRFVVPVYETGHH